MTDGGGGGAGVQKMDAVTRATGKSRAAWFALLDKAGARKRSHREIAASLRDQHGVSAWWAQKITVEYELARGMRKPGERADRTFSVGASKTIAAPVADVFRAFTNSTRRKRWLDAALRLRRSTPNKTARFEWNDGTRVVVAVVPAKAGKTQLTVEHERIAGAGAAARLKSFWRKQVGALKTHLESRAGR